MPCESEPSKYEIFIYIFLIDENIIINNVAITEIFFTACRIYEASLLGQCLMLNSYRQAYKWSSWTAPTDVIKQLPARWGTGRHMCTIMQQFLKYGTEVCQDRISFPTTEYLILYI